MSEIMEVPLPLAAVRFLMSFLTLKISICWSVSSSVGMVGINLLLYYEGCSLERMMKLF